MKDKKDGVNKPSVTINYILSADQRDERKKNLTRLYDVINEIAEELNKKGISTSDWFYSDEELQRIADDPSYDKI